MAKLGDDVKMIPGPVPLVAPTGPMWAGTGAPDPSPLTMTPGRAPLMPPEERAAWQAAHQQDLAQAAQRERELRAVGHSGLQMQEQVPDSEGHQSVTLADGRRVLVNQTQAVTQPAAAADAGLVAPDAHFRDNTKPLAAPDDPNATPGQQPQMDQIGRAGMSAGMLGGPEPKLSLPKDPAAMVYDTTKEQEAIRHQAVAEYNTTALAATAKNLEALEVVKYDEAAAKAEAAYQDTLTNASNSYAAVAAKLNDLSPTIDPGRIWNNKDAGQKVASGLAAFLFGFSGKGIEYMQQVQAEIDTDVKAQQAEYENASNKLKTQLAAQGNIYAMHRDAGLDARTARETARKNMHDRWANQIEAIKASGAGPEVLAKGELLAQQAALKGNEIDSKRDIAMKEQGTRNKAQAIEIYKIEKESRDRMNLAILGEQRKEMAKQDEMAQGIQREVSKLAAGQKLIEATKEAVGGDFFDKAYDKVALTLGDIPGIGGLVRLGESRKGDKSPFVRADIARKNQETLNQIVGESANTEGELKDIAARHTRPGDLNPGFLKGLESGVESKLEGYRGLQQSMNTKGASAIPGPARSNGSSVKSLKKE